MGYEFWKGHGTENDFVLLLDPDGSIDLTPARVRALCDRRAGIGGDGVLRVIRTAALVEREGSALPVAQGALRPTRDQGPHQPEWFMDYRNSDGSVSEMCGNGLRVFARFLLDEGLVDESLADEGLVPEGPIKIGTRAGVKTVSTDRLTTDRLTTGRPTTGRLTTDMGTAAVLGETKVSAAGYTWPAVHVDLGNPHAVAFVDSLDDPGALTEPPSYDQDLYPDGVNVEFVLQRGPDHLAMRVYERGSGETRSCGTGACAAMVAAVPEGPATVRVDVPGGTLTVSRDESGHVFLAGPAVIVARGWTDL